MLLKAKSIDVLPSHTNDQQYHVKATFHGQPEDYLYVCFLKLPNGRKRIVYEVRTFQSNQQRFLYLYDDERTQIENDLRHAGAILGSGAVLVAHIGENYDSYYRMHWNEEDKEAAEAAEAVTEAVEAVTEAVAEAAEVAVIIEAAEAAEIIGAVEANTYYTDAYELD